MIIHRIKKLSTSEFVYKHNDTLTIGPVLLGMIVSGIGSLQTMQYYCYGLGLGTFQLFAESLSVREIIFFFLGNVVSIPFVVWSVLFKGRNPQLLVFLFIPLGWMAFPFIYDRKRIYNWGLKYIKGLRQVACFLGILVLILWIFIARNYNLPMTDGYWAYMVPPGEHEPRRLWIPKKDFSEAPFMIQLGGKYFYCLLITGGFLLYGAFRKELIPTPTRGPFI